MKKAMVAVFAAALLVTASGARMAGVGQAHWTIQWSSPDYHRTDLYNVGFYARGKTYYNLLTDGLHVYQSLLRMDVTSPMPAYLNCDVSKITWANGSGQSNEKLWYNGPFPLNYNNTPDWDWWTWENSYPPGNFDFQVKFWYSASRNEVCSTSGGNTVGVQWTRSTSGWSSSAYTR